MGPLIQLGRRAAAISALVFGLSVSGCEGVALLGRESLKVEPAEFVAEVAGVDSRSKQIHLRPNSERITVVAYTDDTRVIYRGREFQTDDLEPGDVITMTVKEEPLGRYVSDFLTLRERRENWDKAR
jgi:hypothetical protein